MVFPLIYLLIMIKLIISSSDDVMKVQEFQKMEKQVKVFACSMLADSSIISRKRQNKIKKYLKKNNFLDDSSEEETLEKVKQFEIALCYDNIYLDKANDIITSFKEGNFDFMNDDSLTKYFDFDSKDDFNKLTKNMKETNQIMEDIRKEEEAMREKRNEDEYMDETLKDLKSKIIKNPKYAKKGGRADLNNMDFTTDKLEREKNKKIDEEDGKFSFKEIIEHPELLRKYVGIKTLIGFIIFMIIISIIDNKNQKRMQEEEEEKKKKMKENENKQGEKNKEENKEKKENDKNVNEDNNNKEIKKDEIKKEKNE